MNDITHHLPAEYDIHPTQGISYLLLFLLLLCLDIFSHLFICWYIRSNYVIYGSSKIYCILMILSVLRNQFST